MTAASQSRVARESSATLPKKANSGGAKGCTQKGKVLHPILPFERWARSVWPIKPVANLRAVIQRSPRTCKYRLKGLDPDFADVIALLRSEFGFSFLEYLMADAEPAWWRGFRRASGLAAMRKKLAEAQRRIAQLELELE